MSAPRVTDALLEDIDRYLYTAVICDVLDGLGYRDQAMRYDIRPLFPEARLVGRAHTVLSADTLVEPEKPYDLEMEAVDTLKPFDVLVTTMLGSTRSCFWGELLSTAARARGARGVVVDGFSRDCTKIIEMAFPVFLRGILPVDSKGRSDVVDLECSIECGDVLVREGDVVFADFDGVVVIPQQVAEEAVRAAKEKVLKEDDLREQLAKGMSVREGFARYGIL